MLLACLTSGKATNRLLPCGIIRFPELSTAPCGVQAEQGQSTGRVLRGLVVSGGTKGCDGPCWQSPVSRAAVLTSRVTHRASELLQDRRLANGAAQTEAPCFAFHPFRLFTCLLTHVLCIAGVLCSVPFCSSYVGSVVNRIDNPTLISPTLMS